MLENAKREAAHIAIVRKNNIANIGDARWYAHEAGVDETTEELIVKELCKLFGFRYEA